MNTRRELIKGGLGLAGVLAASKSPAFVKSIIAASNTAFSQVKFPNPYISDGLIAMWDGVWNAGWDMHDQNATMWIDLVGGNNGILNGNYQIEENCINFLDETGYAALARQYSWYDSEGCVEFVVLPYGVKRGNYNHPFISLHNGLWDHASNNICLRFKYDSTKSPYWFPRINTYNGMNIDVSDYWENSVGGAMNNNPIAMLYSKSTVYLCDEICDASRAQGYIYNSGAFFNRGINNTNGYAGKYYAVRIYSRTLTQEERTHNYAIDKERFGLP